jgi:hypothetical protein
MSDERGEPCIRRRIKLKDGNCYLVVGKDFVHCCLPYENRPETWRENTDLHAITEEINKIRGDGDASEKKMESD